MQYHNWGTSMTLGWKILIVLLAILGAFATGYHRGDVAGDARVQSAWDKAVIEAERARAVRLAAMRALDQELQAGAAKEREINAKSRATLLAQRDSAIGELRNRPARRDKGIGDVPQPAGPGAAGVWATGAQLYGDDAEFLARRAFAADVIRTQRDSCYRLYNEAKEKLKRASN